MNITLKIGIILVIILNTIDVAFRICDIIKNWNTDALNDED